MFCIVNSNNVMIEGGFFDRAAASEACQDYNEDELCAECSSHNDYQANYNRVLPQMNGSPDFSEEYADDEPDTSEDCDDGMSDMEADADTLRMAGWGTDEDYGIFTDD